MFHIVAVHKKLKPWQYCDTHICNILISIYCVSLIVNATGVKLNNKIIH